MNTDDLSKHQSGFALVEALVALMIFSLVGLMAWQGMDAMVLGTRVVIDKSAQSASYDQLIRQFDQDCNAMVDSSKFQGVPMIVSDQDIWWVRSDRSMGLNAWRLVGYSVAMGGLTRVTSQGGVRPSDMRKLWQTVRASAGSMPLGLVETHSIKQVLDQKIILHGDSAFAAAGQLNMNDTASTTETAPPMTDMPRGMTAQWTLAGDVLAITRSCVIGHD